MPGTPTMQIREANADDAAIITAFNIAMALETEAKHLDPQTARRGVELALRRLEHARYFLAEVDGRAVGQCMITYEWSDWRAGLFWWIQSVYVQPAWRRRGVFRALHAQVGALAEREPDVCGLRLYVEHENTAAQATYLSLGMQRTDYHLYEQLKPGIVFLQP